jgi:hypothetical protein
MNGGRQKRGWIISGWGESAIPKKTFHFCPWNRHNHNSLVFLPFPHLSIIYKKKVGLPCIREHMRLFSVLRLREEQVLESGNNKSKRNISSFWWQIDSIFKMRLIQFDELLFDVSSQPATADARICVVRCATDGRHRLPKDEFSPAVPLELVNNNIILWVGLCHLIRQCSYQSSSPNDNYWTWSVFFLN